MTRAYRHLDDAAKRRIIRAATARLQLTNKAIAAREGVTPVAIQAVLWRARHKGGEMRHGRRDSNESTILSSVDALGGLWVPEKPLDGWLWNRRCWNLCEVKRPDKEGHKHEFTDDQLKLIIRLKERSIPFHILRTDADVLTLMGAKRTA